MSLHRVAAWLAVCSLCALLLAGCGASPVSAPDAPSAASSAPREIPFTVGAAVRTCDFTGTDSFFGQVIRSRKALEDLPPDDACPLARYTEAYFADKALLVLYVTLESSSMQLQIDGLALQNGELTVQYTTTRPDPATADMACWQVLVEVSADAVSDVQTVTGERRRVTLTSSRV